MCVIGEPCSHQVPVQLACGHLLQQRLQAALEEHLEAEVVLNDQGGLQAPIGNLHPVECIGAGRRRRRRSEREAVAQPARVPHLLPDVVMREETTQFTFGERPAMIRVLVSRQHMNPQRLDVGLIQRSEAGGGENEALSNDTNTSY